MTRSSSLPRRLVVLLGSMAIIAACSGATPSASVAPSSEASASVAPSASEIPFEATAYPADAEAPCGVDPYTGLFKKITAVDRLTVEFQLCNPDVAFLSKVAFSAFGIQDSAYLEAHAADKSYLDNPNGTGPYKLGSWEKGNRLVLNAFDGYWGEAARTPNVEFRWSDTSSSNRRNNRYVLLANRGSRRQATSSKAMANSSSKCRCSMAHPGMASSPFSNCNRSWTQSLRPGLRSQGAFDAILLSKRNGTVVLSAGPTAQLIRSGGLWGPLV